MRIRSAQVTDFRNIAHTSIQFSPGLNALVGTNGQGKTNLLEALYCTAALRPLRNVPRLQLIRAGTTEARVSVSVHQERSGLDRSLCLTLGKASRLLAKDEKRCDGAAFLGVLTAVSFTPDDLEISKGGPELRRRFLDRALLNTRPAYLATALRYSRALKSRNRLLADEASDALLDAYDVTLAALGSEVSVARAQYVAELAPSIVEAFARIASPAPSLRIRYRSSLAEALDRRSVVETNEGFRRLLVTRRTRDRQRRTTSVGPHLDDLEVELGDTAVKLRASQGQHRALVLAMKLAEIAHLAEILGEPPVLLLDDISSELDAHRSRHLFDALAELDAQVVLTTTDEAQVPDHVRARLGPAKVFDVCDGKILPRHVA